MDALNDIRSDIDNIDSQLIRLLAQRQILVEKVGRLKPKGDKSAVRANDRVAQVIANRRKAVSYTHLTLPTKRIV